jgi:hypothetical protein
MTLTLPKCGLGSPLGLPNTQSPISRVKTPRLEMCFIPSERSQTINVEIGLTQAIRTSTAQVMVKRRAGSQNRTPVCAGGL